MARLCDMPEGLALAERERCDWRPGLVVLDMELIWERFEMFEDLGAVDVVD